MRRAISGADITRLKPAKANGSFSALGLLCLFPARASTARNTPPKTRSRTCAAKGSRRLSPSASSVSAASTISPGVSPIPTADAAVDPMSDPAVREAVTRATFEHLVGFQLTQDQLRYNVTR